MAISPVQGNNVNSGQIVDGTIVAADLADAAVTLAKMADLAADRVIGRANGAGTGVPTALTAAQTLTLLGGGTAATGTGAVALADSPTHTTQITLTGANGAALTLVSVTELLTIAAAATTDTSTTFTAGDVVLFVTCRVTVVIPTAATFDIGIAGATTRFGTGISVAANTTNIIPGASFGNPITAAAAVALRVTPNAQPADNSGRLRITWWVIRPTAPTS